MYVGIYISKYKKKLLSKILKECFICTYYKHIEKPLLVLSTSSPVPIVTRTSKWMNYYISQMK